MPTVERRLYPATVINLCTREVVGWSMADHPLVELDIRQSVGRTGSRFDDAAAASFFVVLKAEIGTTVWETKDRPHSTFSVGPPNITTGSGLLSTIGYITPYQATVRCHQWLDLAA
ncbi:hypothetical protein ACFWR9_16530 [Streptomyces sp. NPDC058534]|uniref:hypothetical protein n=1 Tax=Streptomyces sp. NPDC058534 TaxID=3346541 RepID=UPI003667CBEF